MHPRPFALLCVAGLCPAIAPGSAAPASGSDPGLNDAPPWTETSLTHKAIEDFDYILGVEKWKNLGDEITLFGVDFPVEFIQTMKFEIDTNGDGDPDSDVRGERGFVDLKGKDENGEVFHYGVRFKNEGDRKYSWTSSGVMTGKVEGKFISIIDANANGSYSDLGVDALVIGSGRGAGFVSKVVNIGGKLYDLEVSADGTTVKTRPYEGETGKLKLGKPAGIKAKPAAAIFTMGKTVSFEMAGAKSGMLVPVGDYKLASAFLERGSETARVRGNRMTPIAVTAGGEHEISWGGPLAATVPAPVVVGTKATVSPAIKITGSAGEEYYEFLPKGKSPSYELFDAETGKRLAKGTFPAG